MPADKKETTPAAGQTDRLLSAVLADEEKRHGAGAAMTADDRADLVDTDIAGTEALAYLVGNEIGVVDGIGMADKDRLLPGIDRGLRHHVDQRAQGSFAPADFFHRD